MFLFCLAFVTIYTGCISGQIKLPSLIWPRVYPLSIPINPDNIKHYCTINEDTLDVCSRARFSLVALEGES
jgi:hypothetical protein